MQCPPMRQAPRLSYNGVRNSFKEFQMKHLPLAVRLVSTEAKQDGTVCIEELECYVYVRK